MLWLRTMRAPKSCNGTEEFRLTPKQNNTFAALCPTIATTMMTSSNNASSKASTVASIPKREQFWNLPNTITMVRIGIVPVLLLFPWYNGTIESQIVAWLFILAALTDIVDGWIARRAQLVTQIGKMLDPLADKLIVSTALIVLLSIGRIEKWGVVMVVVVVGRELAVTGLRGIASSQGTVMAASWMGKLKTFSQNFSIGAFLFPETTLGLPAHTIGHAMLGCATLLTLLSGYQYFVQYFSQNSESN